MGAALTTYFLEMTDPIQLQPSRRVVEDLAVERSQMPYGALNRFFYHTVGAAWQLDGPFALVGRGVASLCRGAGVGDVDWLRARNSGGVL